MCRAVYSEMMTLLRLRASLIAVLISVPAVLAGCKAELDKRYPLRGQILAIAAETRADGRREITLKHDDIPNFMPAMTMAYFVREPAVLDRFAPGDLISATLVLEGSDMYVADLKKTGHGEVAAGARAVRAMDIMEPGDEVPDDPLQDTPG